MASSPMPATDTLPPDSSPPTTSGNDAAAAHAAPQLTAPRLHPKLDGKDPARRPSVQFLSHANTGLPTGSPKPARSGTQRRMSSPPPPPVFRPRVSFDTFDKPADFIEENSFTLIAKHKDYEYTKRSRTFLCGLDSNDYSEFALEWLIDELVDDGDEIVCLRVVEKDSSLAADPSLEAGRYRKEALELMRHIQTKNHEGKAINLVLEFSVGKVNKVIDDMINLYEPAILVVGTRGRRLDGFQGLLPGSVSKYCLQHSPVPVIVVRPNSKRAKSKRKRIADPSRHGYRDILDRSEGGHLLDLSHRGSLVDIAQPATEAEAAAVAAAIGYKDPNAPAPAAPQEPQRPTSMTSYYTFGRDDSPEDFRTPSPEDLRSPGVIMKSPELQNLDSPVISSQSSESEDEDEDEDEDEEEHEGGIKTGVSSDLRAEDPKDLAQEQEELTENGGSAKAKTNKKQDHPPEVDTGSSTAVDVTDGDAHELTHHNHQKHDQEGEEVTDTKAAPAG